MAHEKMWQFLMATLVGAGVILGPGTLSIWARPIPHSMVMIMVVAEGTIRKIGDGVTASTGITAGIEDGTRTAKGVTVLTIMTVVPSRGIMTNIGTNVGSGSPCRAVWLWVTGMCWSLVTGDTAIRFPWSC